MHERVDHTPSVLFVCLGNICRSPMAEGAFRAAARRLALDVVVESAGTASYHTGNPPDPRAIATASAHGVNIAAQTARQLEPADFFRFTHIIALDKANLEGIKPRRPREAGAAVSLLLDWLDGHEGQAVPDPYYGEAAEFEAAWQIINRAAQALAAALAQEAQSARDKPAQPPRST
ncbi:MAG: low molecular weight protein-tyrosine-phosphatase [Erythrobacter sp.]